MGLLNKIKEIKILRKLHEKVFYPKIVTNPDGKYLVRNSSDRTYASPEYERELRPYFHKFQKGVFVDIGAHIGKYTIMMSNLGMDVVAVEPDKDNFQTLLTNIRLNKNNSKIIPINRGCWNANGKAYFNRDQFSSARNSIVMERDGKVEIQVSTLDSIVKEQKLSGIKLIKIDAEGAEPKIFEGAINTLSSQSPVIIFENWDNDLGARMLEEIKFTLKRVGYKLQKISRIYYMAEKSRTE